MAQENPFDEPAQQATAIIRARIEEQLAAVEAEVKPLLDGDLNKTWLVMASALFASALEIMADAEPDEGRFIESVRKLTSSDPEQLRAFFQRVRADYEATPR